MSEGAGELRCRRHFFNVIGNSSENYSYVNQEPCKSRAQVIDDVELEDIKPFFQFVIIKVIILNQEIMHVKQIRIGHSLY